MATLNHYVENFTIARMVKNFTHTINEKINKETYSTNWSKSGVFNCECSKVINHCALIKMHYSGNSYTQEELIRIVYTKILSLIKIRKPKTSSKFNSYIEPIILDSVEIVKKEIIDKNIEIKMNDIDEGLEAQELERQLTVFKSGDINAIYKELSSFEPLISKWAYSLKETFFSIPLEFEDLHNELLGNLCVKMGNYNYKEHDSLFPYINKVLEYCGINICRKLTSNKQRINNFSIYHSQVDENLYRTNFDDINVQKIWDFIEGHRKVFTDNEFKILRSYCRTESLTITAREINMNRQSVQRHFKTACKKFTILWKEASL